MCKASANTLLSWSRFLKLVVNPQTVAAITHTPIQPASNRHEAAPAELFCCWAVVVPRRSSSSSSHLSSRKGGQLISEMEMTLQWHNI
uniref:Secreted protein n=1 Tax=Ditylenchus dipsaci TaxID=166011 RepID=A0A915DM70_9BILA